MLTDEGKGQWIRSVLRFLCSRTGVTPLVMSIIVSGLPAVTFVLLLVHQRRELMSVSSGLSHAFGAIWLGIGPYLILRFDEASSNLIREVENIVQGPSNISRDLMAWYRRFFGKLSWASSAVLMGFGAFFWGSAAVSVKTLGVTGGRDLFYWVGLLLAMWGGVLAGIGFHGIVIMIALVRRASKVQFRLEPLHYDGVGGLGFFGHYIMLTTGMFASGALFVPFVLHCAAPEGTAAWLGYCVLGTFSLFVLASFTYPVYIVHESAARARAREIESIAARYRELSARAGANAEADGLDNLSYEELTRLSREYSYFRDVRMYPFGSRISSKLVLSVVFPLILKAVEQIIEKAV